MSTVAQLTSEITNAKDTPSGLVEWNNNSLDSIMLLCRDLIQTRGIYQAADVSGMQLIPGTETHDVIIDGVGIFLYASTGTPNGTTIFAAAGGGVWKLQTSAVAGVTALSGLSDVTISAPANGQVLKYNSGSSKWENALVVPATVVQQQALYNNVSMNGALPAVTSSGTYNIVLGIAALPSFTTGDYNIVIAPRALSDMKQGSNSVVLTPRTSLHAGTTGAEAVHHSVVIGDCGALDDLYVSNSLTNCIAIGTNGVQRVTVTNAGIMHFNFNPANVDTKDFQLNGTVHATGNVALDGTLGVSGVTTFSNDVFVTSAHALWMGNGTINFSNLSGPGTNTFKIGDVDSGVVAASTANYLPVVINGVVVKVIIAV